MKKNRIGISLIFGSFLAAISLVGQDEGAMQKQDKYVKVSTLNSIEANQEFQRNVQLVQAQRQQAIQLNMAIEQATDPEKKAELSKQLEALTVKLNENNQTMLKRYGFTLNRNYQMVIEKSHIYMFVTDEEAAAVQESIEKAEKTVSK